ncbi:DUF4386 family protein [Corallincola platygyrae]|uniref:DUF4386 family protein n=1 Tax=Corallincola platygyrae TaxID=1193278 RepID=A0ABW4XK32_9GAMM
MGRWIGALVLLQLVLGIYVNFALTAPLYGEPGFAVNGAKVANHIGASVLLAVFGSLVSLTVANLAYGTFKAHNPVLARGYMMLVCISVTLVLVENINTMALVSFSQTLAQADPTSQSTIQALPSLFAAYRNWAHYIGLIMSGLMLLAFYLVLFRYRLIPMLLAGFGILAVLSQLSSVSRPLFGLKVDFMLIAPLALSQLLLGLWLIFKGFNSHQETAVSPAKV